MKTFVLTSSTFLTILVLTVPSSLAQKGKKRNGNGNGNVHPVELVEDLDESVRSRLIRQLEAIRNAAYDFRHGALASAYSAFEQAAASDSAAVELFLKCTKELDFDRKGRRAIEWLEWKGNDRNKERRRKKEFGAALRLQLQYLLLTMKVSILKPEEVDKKRMYYEKLIGFAGQLGENWDKLEEERWLLSQSVFSSVFARVYNVSQHLKAPEGWETAPGNLSGIYDNAVLPYLRENDRWDEVISIWMTRIRQETEKVQALKDPAKREEFAETKLPSLQWKMAEDILLSGQSAQALSDMLSILGAHPTHPSAMGWIKATETRLIGDQEAVAGGNATGGTENGGSTEQPPPPPATPGEETPPPPLTPVTPMLPPEES